MQHHPGFRSPNKASKQTQEKITKRYLTKIGEFSILSEEELREKAKGKMSSTDRIALEDAFRQKLREKHTQRAEEILVSEAAKEIHAEITLQSTPQNVEEISTKTDTTNEKI